MPLLSKQPADRADNPNPSRSIPWTVVLSVGLSVAFLDLTLNLLVAGASTYSGWTVLPDHIAATLVLTVATMILLLTALRLISRSCDIQVAALSIGIFLLLLLPSANLLLAGDNLLPADSSESLHLIAAMAIAMWMAWRSYPAFRAQQTLQPATPWSMAGTFIPLSFLLILAGVWRSSRTASFDVATGLLITVGVLGVLVSIRNASRSRMRRIVFGRGILVTGAATIMFCGLAGIAGPRQAGGAIAPAHHKRPLRQVILLTVDTLRADRLSCYGGPVPTPHFDALASDGVVYENAISPAPWTLPAFTSIMTGVYPNVHQATHYSSRVPAGLETLAEQLSKAGLKTSAIGDNPFLLAESGMSQGFAEYRFFSGPAGRASLGGRLLHGIKPDRYIAAPTTNELASMATGWLIRHAGEEFFLWLHFFDPHLPYAPPAEFAPQGPPPPGLGATFDDLDGARGGYIGATATQRAWIQSLYDAEVRHVDAAVGRVIRSLKNLGVYDNVHIVFASDHGEEFWEHDGFEHGHSLYQELIRVPLVIKSNRLRSTSPRVSAAVSTTAITPTILDLVGAAHDRNRFSVPSLVTNNGLGATGDSMPAIYSGGQLYFDDREAVIWGNHKYIRSIVSGREEIYNLQSDGAESASLVRDHADLLEIARKHSEQQHQEGLALRELLNVEDENAEVSASRLRKLQSLGYVNE